MLLTIDWQPWFSYGWWHDIGVPTLGAIGSVAVGAGAVVVALRSAQIAKDAAERAADTAARAERQGFGLLATEWVTTSMDELEHGSAGHTETVTSSSPSSGGVELTATRRRPHERSSGELKQELDVRAASVGQYSVDLVESLEQWRARIGDLGTSTGRALMALAHRYSLQSIQEWVAEPTAWYGRELEATRVSGDYERWVAEAPLDLNQPDRDERPSRSVDSR